ncbi:MAG: secretin N-terminal domain-containing protein, partial [Candidatus Omnitrophota bacterium]
MKNKNNALVKVSFVSTLTILILSGTVLGQQEEMKFKVFKIKYRSPESLLPAARHLKSGKGKVTVDPNSNSLIVVDYPSNLSRIAGVITTLDVPLEQVEIRVLIADVTDSFLKKAGIAFNQDVIPPKRFNNIHYSLDTDKASVIRSEITLRTLSGQPAALQVAEEEVLWGVVKSASDSSTITVAPAYTRAAGNFLEVLPR